MFSYYGTKKKLAKYYPDPLYDTIIEPFAGAAQYSLFGDNWRKQVILIDSYDIIVKIWYYLINARPNDILQLPDMYPGDNVDSHSQLCNEERWLIGFCINGGSAMPKKTVQKYNNWNRSKIQIAKNLYKIKHWVIKHGSHLDAPNISATWYIDPPYQHGGKWYRFNNKTIDYYSLAQWCIKRMGQVIVCENMMADWLPFAPLAKLHGQLHTTTEAIWTR